jgi:hypothetical protein
VSTVKALLDAVICFDINCPHGTICSSGQLGVFVTDDVSGAEGTIALKQSGTRMFIDVTRTYARLRVRVPEVKYRRSVTRGVSYD